ncbi:MAG: glycosyltransferase family 4 protein [Anaerolineae bacterium]|nr:glycosyltransferase family 4 protein [Anaerolineae bacterium]
MIKVAALTSGQNTPSSRFRVRQHIELLHGLGVQVQEYAPLVDKHKDLPGWPQNMNRKLALPLRALWQGSKVGMRLPGLIGSLRSDVIWLERELLPGYLTLEPLLKHPFVFDIDDAIWLSRPHGVHVVQWISSHADAVIAGNSYLANWVADYARDVHIVPTAVDTKRFVPLTPEDAVPRPFAVGWTGTRVGLDHLERIEQPLKRFLTQYSDAEIRVMADHPPNFNILPEERYFFIPWSAETEVSFVQNLDVGLMPLANTELSHGKCSFKMLQYMACSVPVIVSPVGMNADVLALGQVGLSAFDNDDWYEALVCLYKDRARAHEFGQEGRIITEQCFSREIIADQISRVFHDL